MTRKTWRKLRARLRVISGASALVFLVLLLGVAGASDTGAALSYVMPRACLFLAGFAGSVGAFNVLGGGWL